jgi:hypothetical protein
MGRIENHLAEVEALLGPNEHLVSWIRVEDIVSATSMIPSIVGVLALTSRRLVFRGSSRRGAVGREIDLAAVRGFEAVWHRNAADLRFNGNPGFAGFLTRGMDTAVPFIAQVVTAIDAAKALGNDQRSDQGVADLAALGDLFERGLLTPEEFATAKSRLLE